MDADSSLIVDYFQMGQTINGTYYASLLRQFKILRSSAVGNSVNGAVSPGQFSNSHI